MEGLTTQQCRGLLWLCDGLDGGVIAALVAGLLARYLGWPWWGPPLLYLALFGYHLTVRHTVSHLAHRILEEEETE